MTELVTEFDSEQIKHGKKMNLKYGITKQKFLDSGYTYVLFNAKNLMFQSLTEEEFLIEELCKTLKVFLKGYKKVLVVGLGNRHISADSFGTECLKHIIATRNLIDAKCEVSAISTSVFGLTGIESADIIKSVQSIIKPDAIIILDTLCANSYDTLVTNFQISNSGLNPGAGVGNKRKGINEKTIKTNIVSIGVPFVVYAKSFVESAINSAMQSPMQSVEKNENLAIFNTLLKQNFNNLVLTVKDVEASIKKTSYVVASAINMALNDYSLDEQKTILGH